ncbi:uncharacterized protein MONBRDRAFT_22149 [Monosiga brevicollis MX1]|uniref:Uncharacterized protein n=1 Tax=Monosiga brevicollis TaxID=81824 RepID=A9UPQ0_MONBE|nr:uncharacterized protein MONBRDRAFT_22149 [Monosiga brevicollis MX1]EDQ92908.1 predicted protein [Monosiga brevicollis MX1]|eukprot:XP_001742670.1 hypothetical protein [Monosiga brevicollis MX1]
MATMNYDRVTAQMDGRHWWLVSKLQESFGDALKSAQLETFLCQQDTLECFLTFTEENNEERADLPSGATKHRTLFVWQEQGPARRSTFRNSDDYSSWKNGFDSDPETGAIHQGSDGDSDFAHSDDEGSSDDVIPTTSVSLATGVSQFECSNTVPVHFQDKCVYFVRRMRGSRVGASAMDIAGAATSTGVSFQDRPPRTRGNVTISAPEDEHQPTPADAPDVSTPVSALGPQSPGAGVETGGEAAPATPAAETSGGSLRSSASVDVTAFTDSVCWGEIEPELGPEIQASFLTSVLPAIAAADWNSCNDDQVGAFKVSVDRMLNAMPDGLDVESRLAFQRKATLRVSHETQFAELRPGGRAIPLAAVNLAEQLVDEWISLVEDLLAEAALDRDVRYQSLQGEFDFWTHRLTLLASITDQLKGSVCQNIINVLISSQSRIVKRWRVVDSAITDASNEARDILKFLESAASSVHAMTTLQPGLESAQAAIDHLVNTVKAGSSLLRHLNSGNFAQVFFTRLSDELAEACRLLLSRTAENDGVAKRLKILNVLLAATRGVRDLPIWLQRSSNEDSAQLRLAASPKIKEAIGLCRQLSKYCDRYVNTFLPLLSRRLQALGKRKSQDSLAELRKPSGRTRLLPAGSTGESARTTRSGSTIDLSLVSPMVFHDVNALRDRLQALEAALQLSLTYSALAREWRACSEIEVLELAVHHADLVENTIAAHRDCLDIVYADDSFSRDVATIWEQTRHVEERLKLELPTWLASINNAKEAIERIQRLRALEHRDGLRVCLLDLKTHAYEAYSEELRELQTVYEREKSNPPIQRSAAPVIGHVLWARRLQDKMAGPMAFFAANPDVYQRASPSAQTRELFEALNGTLVEYQQRWLSEWRSQHTAMASGMCATLLVQHPTSNRLVVNIDQNVLTLMEEVRAMSQADIQVPAAMHALVTRASKYKQFSDQLTGMLDRFYALNSAIDELIKPLLLPQYHAVMQAMRPGLVSLTWEASNIDVFVRAVCDKLDVLDTGVQQLQDKLACVIEPELNGVAASTFVHFPRGEHSAETMLHGRVELVSTQDVTTKHRLSNAFVALQEMLTSVELLRSDSFVHDNSWDASQLLKHKLKLINLIQIRAEQSLDSCIRHTLEDLLQWMHSEQHDFSLMVLVEMAAPRLTAKPTGPRMESFMDDIMADAASVYMESMQFVREASASVRSSMRAQTASLREHLSRLSVRSASATRRERQQLASRTMAEQIDELHDLERALVTIHTSTQDMAASDVLRGDGLVTLSHDVRRAWRALWAECQNELTALDNSLRLWGLTEQPSRSDLADTLTVSALVNPDSSLDRIKRVEEKIESLPDALFTSGPLVLDCRPIKFALRSEYNQWKVAGAARLHTEVREQLQQAEEAAVRLRSKLEQEVTSLIDLQGMIDVLQAQGDAFAEEVNLVPIEEAYKILHLIGLELSDAEVKRLSDLRTQQANLDQLSHQVRYHLTKERKPEFERQIDGHVKTLMVASIHLRNSFDASGPLVKGISADEALVRLQRFEELYDKLAEEQRLLATVQNLLSIPITQFAELNFIRSKIQQLWRLYHMYQTFVKDNTALLETPWQKADLDATETRLQELAQQLEQLPSGLRQWEAFSRMAETIKRQLESLPLLKLMAKPFIRDRHWREIMHITGTTFPLEGLTLSKVLSLQLVDYAHKIQELARLAAAEADLEEGLAAIQSLWNDSAFPFHGKPPKLGFSLERQATQGMIASAQDALMRLNSMLTSPSLGPHRNEIVSWLAKLRGVSTFLQQWLDVQGLTHEMKIMMVHVVMEGPRHQLNLIERDFLKFAQTARDVGNIMQFCFGSDGSSSKASALQSLFERLEGCRRTLADYLQGRRNKFFRFYFASDPILLRALSETTPASDAHELSDAWRAILPMFQAFSLGTSDESNQDGHCQIKGVYNAHGEQLELTSPVQMGLQTDVWMTQLLSQVSRDVRQRIHALCGKLRARPAQAITLAFDSLRVAGLDASGDDRRNSGPEQRVATPVDLLDDEPDHGEASPQLPSGNNGQDSSAQGAAAAAAAAAARHSFYAPFNALQSLNSEPLQMTLMALRLHWTALLVWALELMSANRNGLKSAMSELSSWIHKVTSSSFFRKRGRKTAQQVFKMQAVLVLLTHFRELTNDLASVRCRDLSDFHWIKHPRWYIDPDHDQLEMHALQATLPFAGDFLGMPKAIFLQPLMMKGHVLLLNVLRQGGGVNGAPIPAISSSGEQPSHVVDHLGEMLGRHVYKITCTRSMNSTSVVRLLNGICFSEVWGVLDDVAQLPDHVLVMAVEHLRLMRFRMQNTFPMASSGQEDVEEPDSPRSGHLQKTSVQDILSGYTAYHGCPFAVFATFHVSNPPDKIPRHLRDAFRDIKCIRPDPKAIIRICTMAAGLFAHAEDVAEAATQALSLCQDLFQNRSELSFGFRAWQKILRTIPEVLARVEAIKNEELALNEAPRRGSNLASGSAHQRVGSVLANKVSNPRRHGTLTAAKHTHRVAADEVERLAVACAIFEFYQSALDSRDQHTIAEVAETVAPKFRLLYPRLKMPVGPANEHLLRMASLRGLTTNGTWLATAHALHSALQASAVTIVLGEPGVGKSTLIETLIGSYAGDETAQFGKPRIHHVYPVCIDHARLFGGVLNEVDWVDGLLTDIVRRAREAGDESTCHWIHLDGNLDGTWASILNCYFLGDEEPTMTLGLGDKLTVPRNVKWIVETADADSPHLQELVEHARVVRVSSTCFEAMHFLEPWLATRRSQEAAILRDLINKIFLPMVEYLQENQPHAVIAVALSTQVRTFSQLLTALLANSVSAAMILPEDNIECYVLFATTWSLGGGLHETERAPFHEAMNKLSLLLPDEQSGLTVFDYNISPLADWESWAELATDREYDRAMQGNEPELFYTPEVVCGHTLLSLLEDTEANVFVVGPYGCGKSQTVQAFLESGLKDAAVNAYAVTSSTFAGHFQRFMSRNTVQRTGQVYGAEGGKPFIIAADDLDSSRTLGEDHAELNELYETLRLLLETGQCFPATQPRRDALDHPARSEASGNVPNNNGGAAAKGMAQDKDRFASVRWIADVRIIATGQPQMAGTETVDSFSRLARHFTVIYLPNSQPQSNQRILAALMASNLPQVAPSGVMRDTESGDAASGHQQLMERDQHYLQVLMELDELSRMLVQLADRWKGQLVPISPDSFHVACTFRSQAAIAKGMARADLLTLTQTERVALWYEECIAVLADRMTLAEHHSRFMQLLHGVLADSETFAPLVPFLNRPYTAPSVIEEDVVAPLADQSTYDAAAAATDGTSLSNYNLVPFRRDYSWAMANSDLEAANSPLAHVQQQLSAAGLCVLDVFERVSLAYDQIHMSAVTLPLTTFVDELWGACFPHAPPRADLEASIRAALDSHVETVSHLDAAELNATASAMVSWPPAHSEASAWPDTFIDFVEAEAVVPVSAAGEEHRQGSCLASRWPILKGRLQQICQDKLEETGHLWSLAPRMLHHIQRLLRVINMPQGHAVFVAPPLARLTVAIECAAIVAQSEMRKMAFTDLSGFHREMRALYRNCGTKNQRCVAVIEGNVLTNDILAEINSYIAVGSIDSLFSLEEERALMEGFQANASDAALESPSTLFKRRLRNNLHFVFLFENWTGQLAEFAQAFPTWFANSYICNVTPLNAVTHRQESVALLLHHPCMRHMSVSGVLQAGQLLEEVCASARSLDLDGLGDYHAKLMAALSHSRLLERVERYDLLHLHRCLQAFVRVYERERISTEDRKAQLQAVIDTCGSTDARITALERERKDNEICLAKLAKQIDAVLGELAHSAADVIDGMADDGFESDDDEHMLNTFMNKRRQTLVAPHGETHGMLVRMALDSAFRRVADAQARLSLKRIDAVRTLPNPPEQIRHVADMLMIALRRPLPSDAATRRNQRTFIDNWAHTAKQLQDPLLLPAIQKFDVRQMDQEQYELLETYVQNAHISETQTRHASKDAAVLLQWIMSMLAYRREVDNVRATASSPLLATADRHSEAVIETATEAANDQPSAKTPAHASSVTTNSAQDQGLPPSSSIGQASHDNVSDAANSVSATGGTHESESRPSSALAQTAVPADAEEKEKEKTQRRSTDAATLASEALLADSNVGGSGSRPSSAAALLSPKTGEDLLRQSTDIAAAQNRYARLVGELQAYEDSQTKLEQSLQAARQQRASFSPYIEAWQAELDSLIIGGVVCLRNALLIAASVALTSQASDVQRRVARESFVRVTAHVVKDRLRFESATEQLRRQPPSLIQTLQSSSKLYGAEDSHVTPPRARRSSEVAARTTRGRRSSLVATLETARLQPINPGRSSSLSMPVFDEVAEREQQMLAHFPVVFDTICLHEYITGLDIDVEDDLGLHQALHFNSETLLHSRLSMTWFRHEWCMLYDPAGLAVSWLQRELQQAPRSAGYADYHLRPQSLRLVKFTSQNLRAEIKLALGMGSFVIMTEITDSAWRDPVVLSLLRRQESETSQGGRALVLAGEVVEWNPAFKLVLVCQTPVPVPQHLQEHVHQVSLVPTITEWHRTFFARLVLSKLPGLHAALSQSMGTLASETIRAHKLRQRLLQLLATPATQEAASPVAAPSALRMPAPSGGAVELSGRVPQTLEEWAAEIVATQREYSLLAGRATATRAEAEKLMSTLVQYDTVALEVASLAHAACIAPALDSTYLVPDVLLMAFDSAVQKALSSGNVSGVELGGVMVGEFFGRIRPQLSEANCKVLEMVLALQLETLGPAPDDISLEEFYQWLQRPDPQLEHDWPTFDVGPAVDSKGGIVPLADLKARVAQVEARIVSATAEVRDTEWLAPLADFVEPIARHRGDWVTWKDGPVPETMALPSGPSWLPGPGTRHFLMILGALRPDRFAQACDVYSQRYLRLRSDVRANIRNIVETITAAGSAHPTVVQCVEPRSTARAFVAQCAEAPEYVIMSVGEHAQPKAVLAHLRMAMARGWWLFLADIESNINLAMTCFRVARAAMRTQRHDQFRLFLLVTGTAHLPEPLLTCCTMVSAAAESTLRRRLAQYLSDLPLRLVTCSSRPEWLHLVHNICLCHLVFQGRALFGSIGWRSTVEFPQNYLDEALDFAAAVYASQSGGSQRMVALRHYMELQYGSALTNQHDRRMLSTLLSMWISNSACKPGYEFFRTAAPPGSNAFQGLESYKMPSINPRLKSRQAQMLDLARQVASSLSLDDAALSSICQLSTAESVKETPSENVSFLLREALRVLLPWLDESGQSAARSNHLARNISSANMPSRLSKPRRSSMTMASVKRTTARARGRDRSERQPLVVHEDRLLPVEVVRVMSLLPSEASLVKTLRKLSSANFNPAANRCFQIQLESVLRSVRRIFRDMQALECLVRGVFAKSPYLVEILRCIADNRVPPSWEGLASPQHATILIRSEQECYTGRSRELIHTTRLASVLAALKIKSVLSNGEGTRFSAEATTREREHLREPPTEGMFVHGVTLYGCYWDNPPGEVREHPLFVATPLPVIHVHYSLPKPPDEGRTRRVARADDLRKKGPLQLPLLRGLSHSYGDDNELFEVTFTSDAFESSNQLVLRGCCVTMDE